MKKYLILGLLNVWVIVLALDGQASENIRRQQVHFKKGASQASIQGHIKGRETIDYILRAQADQTMTVNIETSNPSAYFNVLPPGSQEAIFIGSVGGSHFEGKLPKDGDYAIRVYLVRAAARRNETAKYTLTVKITGPETASVGKALDQQGKAFDRKLSLLGISFHVTSPNTQNGNTVTITPAGLQTDNLPISRPIDGLVIGAEVADLNVDQSPEIYVYGRSPEPQARGVLVAYSANKRKSLSEIYLPPLTDEKDAGLGYHGHDEMAVLEGVLGRRFPVAGKMRQLQYKLVPGEAGWVLKLDKVMEY